MFAVTLPMFVAIALMLPPAYTRALSLKNVRTVCDVPMPTRASMLPPPKLASETLVLDAHSV